MQTRHVLIIGTVWPEPASSAAGSRMMQLMALFEEQGYAITFSSAAAHSDFSTDLSVYGVAKTAITLNDSSFDEFIKTLRPDVVLFDRFMTEEQYGWRVAKNCPEAIRILDTEDLHCLRAARELAFKQGRVFQNADLLNETALREIAAIYRSDLSLIISEAEMKLLTEFFKADPSLLHYIPFLFDEIIKEDVAPWPSFEQREHFISIGNFLHEPNRNAVLYLKETIWPLIRRALPQAELHVYGAYPMQQINQMHKPAEGFIVKGRAADAPQVVRKAKVSLAPLRIGAGLKGKLAESMCCGTPSVTTSIGAEGMHNSLPWNGFISDDPHEFAQLAVTLYQDENMWKEKQENGLNIINSLFSKKEHGNMFIKRLTQLQENRAQHRADNFTGAMLLHHTAASSMYMSKWIEAKNK